MPLRLELLLSIAGPLRPSLRRQVSELKKTIEETKNMTVQRLIYLGKILDAAGRRRVARW